MLTLLFESIVQNGSQTRFVATLAPQLTIRRTMIFPKMYEFTPLILLINPVQLFQLSHPFEVGFVDREEHLILNELGVLLGQN